MTTPWWRIWTQISKEGQTRFTIEVSALKDAGAKCPNCGDRFALTTLPFATSLQAVLVKGETKFWQGICSCGVELLVFND
jgi:hypothetical protein